jgi:predicted nicotinamide N-methyase
VPGSEIAAAPGGASPIRTEVVSLSFAATTVRLVRVCDLRQVVDAAALLGAESAAEPPYWMHLWPGALALAGLLASDSTVVRGRRLVELGCGLGLPALVAAKRGASVIATDREIAALRLLGRSAALNGAAVELVQLDWAWPPLGRVFDLCLAADVAYDAAAEEGLVRALAGLLAPRGEAWLADSVNTHRRTLTERLAGAGFEVRADWCREQEEGRSVWVRTIRASRVS